MLKGVAGASLALLFLVAPANAAPAAGKTTSAAKTAPFCKTLKGEWVGVGEDGTRKEAETRLDKEIAAWRERYQVASAKTKARKVGCNMYIQLLDEYFCTAEAVVCR
jgi:hypothetical protein